MQKKSQFAFTMLELMITVAIAAILLISGIPSFQRFSQRQHMKAAVTDLQNDLTMAKSGQPFHRLCRQQRLERRLDCLRRQQQGPATPGFRAVTPSWAGL
jgi:prepilin-type N-terminal cleavage/methylation domain-containing protein